MVPNMASDLDEEDYNRTEMFEPAGQVLGSKRKCDSVILMAVTGSNRCQLSTSATSKKAKILVASEQPTEGAAESETKVATKVSKFFQSSRSA